VQLLSTRYEESDGTTYAPIYPGSADPLQVVAGLADARIMAWAFTRTNSGWTLGGGLGHTIPSGRPPENPLGRTLGAASQPFRSGSGTVVPVASFTAVKGKERWGGWLSATTSIPVAATPAGYRAPWSVGISGGPSFKPIPKLQLLWTVDPYVEGRPNWNGDPVGGRVAVATSLAIIGSVAPTVVLQGQVSATVWQTGWDSQDDGSGPSVIAGFGVSWSPRKAGSEPDEHDDEPDEH
jgi:hypothetical protein